MAIVRWSPFQELDSMERRMRRLFEQGGLVIGLESGLNVLRFVDEIQYE